MFFKDRHSWMFFKECYFSQINRLQIDNQLPGAVFPVVFYPGPLPKSIAVDSSPKPFLEVSLMQRLIDQQSFVLIKYFKVCQKFYWNFSDDAA